ncbi:hypothetical protein KSP40_PGU020060 [Platanthera guangdongensis]|uniref:Ribosomal protein L2 n=1 Tax=Platanthera guangdongensis TaxID=2320717 RepID=A0ABR2MKB4_9ASPA
MLAKSTREHRALRRAADFERRYHRYSGIVVAENIEHGHSSCQESKTLVYINSFFHAASNTISGKLFGNPPPATTSVLRPRSNKFVLKRIFTFNSLSNMIFNDIWTLTGNKLLPIVAVKGKRKEMKKIKETRNMKAGARTNQAIPYAYAVTGNSHGSGFHCMCYLSCSDP